MSARRHFGVRRLAAAFGADTLALYEFFGRNGWHRKSGSKLPHSKNGKDTRRAYLFRRDGGGKGPADTACQARASDAFRIRGGRRSRCACACSGCGRGGTGGDVLFGFLRAAVNFDSAFE